MRNIGIVTERKDDMATVKVMRTSSCGENCASCKGGCSVSGTHIEAVNTVGAEVGDKVVAAISDNAAVIAALVAYFIPLTMAIVTAIISYIIGYGEVVTFFVAILGLFAGSVISKLISVRCKSMFLVRIVKILEKDNS